MSAFLLLLICIINSPYLIPYIIYILKELTPGYAIIFNENCTSPKSLAAATKDRIGLTSNI
jgi:hypothetical protein